LNSFNKIPYTKEEYEKWIKELIKKESSEENGLISEIYKTLKKDKKD